MEKIHFRFADFGGENTSFLSRLLEERGGEKIDLSALPPAVNASGDGRQALPSGRPETCDGKDVTGPADLFLIPPDSGTVSSLQAAALILSST